MECLLFSDLRIFSLYIHIYIYIFMSETLYLKLPSAPLMSQESFNIETIRKYHQNIIDLPTRKSVQRSTGIPADYRNFIGIPAVPVDFQNSSGIPAVFRQTHVKISNVSRHYFRGIPVRMW